MNLRPSHATKRFLGALTLIACSASSSAFAEDAKTPAASSKSASDAAAQVQFLAGRARFKAADYKGAAESFKRALDLSGSPNASFALARCFVELGDLAAGYDMMQRSINDGTAKAAAEPEYAKTRDAAKIELEALEHRVGHVTLQIAAPPSDAQIMVNGRALDLVRVGQPVVVTPGHVIVVATAPGRDAARGEADVGAGETKTIRLLLSGAPAGNAQATPVVAVAPVATTQRGFSRMQIAGLVVAGIGVVALGVFIGTDVAASGEYSKLQNGCVGHCTDPAYDSVISRGKTFETVSNVGLVVGIAGVLGGGALFLLGRSKTEPTASIGATATQNGATLRFTHAF